MGWALLGFKVHFREFDLAPFQKQYWEQQQQKVQLLDNQHSQEQDL